MITHIQDIIKAYEKIAGTKSLIIFDESRNKYVYKNSVNTPYSEELVSILQEVNTCFTWFKQGYVLGRSEL